MRGDDAAPHTIENARRKAYTAMTFKQPTAEYAKKLQDPNSVAHRQITLPNVIAIPAASRSRSTIKWWAALALQVRPASTTTA